MKRLLVIAAFVVVVLGALGGGAYLFMRGETDSPRKPVVARQAENEPEVERDDSEGPLGSPDRVNPDGTSTSDKTRDDVDSTRNGGDARNPDRTTPRPNRDIAKPPPRDMRPSETDTPRPVNPNGAETPADPESAPTDGLVTLNGRVTDDANNPVAGAGIMLSYTVPSKPGERTRTRSSDGIQTLSVAATDNDGFYSASVKLTFPGESAPLAIKLWAQAGNGLRTEGDKALEIRAGEIHENVDFTVPRGGELIGQVVNQRFEALAGARVTIRFTDGGPSEKAFHTVTNEDGAFQFSGLKPGGYQVFATMEGFQPDGDAQSVDVSAGQATNMAEPVKMKPVTGVKLRLTSTGTQPTGAFTITFYSPGTTQRSSAKADAEGNALISGVPPDATEMSIHMQGYEETERLAISVIQDDHTDVGEVSLTAKLSSPGD